MSFAELGLSSEALGAVDDLGYGDPTPVQVQVIPEVLAGRDVAACAQTGTGKTGAFVLPALDRLQKMSRAATPRMLVIAPVRELALQIADVCRVAFSRAEMNVCVIVGGRSLKAQVEQLRAGVDVVVATPGRLIDLVEQDMCTLNEIRLLVIDEADRMLDMGFMPDVKKIVAHVPSARQTLLFSATLGEDVLDSVATFTHEPIRMNVDRAASVAQTINQFVIYVEPEAKKRTLIQVLKQEGSSRVLVFVRNKQRCDHLSNILRKKGFRSSSLHGGQTQAQRMRVLDQFAQGEVEVLVATDVLARGIDVEHVAYVVVLDVPHEIENYVHRVGRTGRAQDFGWSLTFCSKAEKRDLRRIEKLTGTPLKPYHA